MPNSNVIIPGATSVVGPTLKRDIEIQLATVERDRRQLEHQLQVYNNNIYDVNIMFVHASFNVQDTIGTRRLSEDRVIK